MRSTRPAEAVAELESLGGITHRMRLFFSIAFLVGGMGLCILDTLAHALANASTTTYYRKQLQSFPTQQTYTRAELADAAWQVWTNRVTLPEQSTYTVADLKTAVVRPLPGTQQDSCDRILFEHAIGRVSGYREPPDRGMALLGYFAMLIGAFLLGGVLFPAQEKQRP